MFIFLVVAPIIIFLLSIFLLWFDGKGGDVKDVLFVVLMSAVPGVNMFWLTFLILEVYDRLSTLKKKIIPVRKTKNES